MIRVNAYLILVSINLIKIRSKLARSYIEVFWSDLNEIESSLDVCQPIKYNVNKDNVLRSVKLGRWFGFLLQNKACLIGVNLFNVRVPGAIEMEIRVWCFKIIVYFWSEISGKSHKFGSLYRSQYMRDNRGGNQSVGSHVTLSLSFVLIDVLTYSFPQM